MEPAEIRDREMAGVPRSLSLAAAGIVAQWNGVVSDKRPLILIHGAGGRAADWPFEWREPAAATAMLGVAHRNPARWINDRAVYAVNLPGHGRSPGSTAPTIEAFADAVEQFLDALSIEPPVLAGHSMGGAIVLELARRRQDRLNGIIILGSAARLPVAPAILDGLQNDFDATVAMIVKYCWHRDASEFYRTVSRRRMAEAGPEVLYGDFLACSRFDASAFLSLIACPALVLAGDSDRMVPPASSEALASALPNASFQVVPLAGHFFHVERTGRVLTLINRFCEALEAKR